MRARHASGRAPVHQGERRVAVGEPLNVAIERARAQAIGNFRALFVRALSAHKRALMKGCCAPLRRVPIAQADFRDRFRTVPQLRRHVQGHRDSPRIRGDRAGSHLKMLAGRAPARGNCSRLARSRTGAAGCQDSGCVWRRQHAGHPSGWLQIQIVCPISKPRRPTSLHRLEVLVGDPVPDLLAEVGAVLDRGAEVHAAPDPRVLDFPDQTVGAVKGVR